MELVCDDPLPGSSVEMPEVHHPHYDVNLRAYEPELYHPLVRAELQRLKAMAVEFMHVKCGCGGYCEFHNYADEHNDLLRDYMNKLFAVFPTGESKTKHRRC